MQRALDFLKNHVEIAFATSEGNRPHIRHIAREGGVQTAAGESVCGDDGKRGQGVCKGKWQGRLWGG